MSGELSLSNLTSWSRNEIIEDFTDGVNYTTVFDQADQYSSRKSRGESYAMNICCKDDVVRRSWLIKFVNCQVHGTSEIPLRIDGKLDAFVSFPKVLLRGSETQGYLILCASKAEAKKCTHTPVWKTDSYVSKTSWSGILEDMQYFATVYKMEEISWLPLEIIESGKKRYNLCLHLVRLF